MKRRSSPKSKTHGGARAPSQRQLRVGELLRHALSDVLTRGNIQDPVLESTIVSVSEVRMSPDLRNATAFVAPLGRQDPAPLLEALMRARKFLRGEVARQIELRYMPELRFEADTAYDYAENVDALLRTDQVAQDLGPASGEPDEEGGPDGAGGKE